MAVIREYPASLFFVGQCLFTYHHLSRGLYTLVLVIVKNSLYCLWSIALQLPLSLFIYIKRWGSDVGLHNLTRAKVHISHCSFSFWVLALMAELSAQEPLLSNGVIENGYSKSVPFSLCLLKWTLKVMMWGIFIVWVSLIVINPSDSFKWIFDLLTAATGDSIFGMVGSLFLIFSAPILIVAVLAYIYLIAFSKEDYGKVSKFPRFHLWTLPVLVDGPFGVVSAAELIGILLFVAYVLWAITVSTIQYDELLSKVSKLESCLMLDLVGLRFGLIGMFCLTFLFLPVARGSVLLRLIDIPFEHATRYHVWLGHLTMMLFTIHGICFMISSTVQGRFIRDMLQWKRNGIANLPGVISLVAGLFMWITSLHPVRKRYFELFFYTHQLYVIFIVFLAMHVEAFFSIVVGAVFLFILDRFLRFCQSRTAVDVISASCLPCGTIEVVLSKPANLRYNALSFIFLQVRELSWLQWHPFSVSSSPLDGKKHIAVLIKVLGDWTEKLRDIICYAPEKQQEELHTQPQRITASVEGPYGHELAYHLMYENLILVAGGIGITPFLAILSDVFHRIEERKPCLPKNILVVWSVKKSKELSLISIINTQSISPLSSNKMHLDIQAFVTQESEPPLEDGSVSKVTHCCPISMSKVGSMSSLVGTGNNMLSGAYFAVSTLGFIVLYGLLQVIYIQPYDAPSWLGGLLLTICMVAGVLIFGGPVLFIWNRLDRRSASLEETVLGDEKDCLKKPSLETETSTTDLMNLMNTRYGRRPSFQEIFNSFAQQKGRTNVGVLVCGPPGLQTTVAKECRLQSLRGRWNEPIFHFHSHSFDL